MSAQAKGWAYVGSLTALGKSRGVSVYEFDGKMLGDLFQTAEVADPTYVAIARGHRKLYAASHSSSVDGRPGGCLSSYDIDPGTGRLELAGRQYGLSPHLAYAVVDSSERWLITASTMGGAVTVLPLGDFGVAGAPTQVVQHRGTAAMVPWPVPFTNATPTPGAAMAHCAELSPSGKTVAVADLGLNRLALYQFDGEIGRLDESGAVWVDGPPKAGPRHCLFHDTASVVFVVQEHDSSVGVYGYGEDGVAPSMRQHISSVPYGFVDFNSPADLHLHPNGRFLYVSNRGHNSIVRYVVDTTTGELSDPTYTTWNIDNPRGFAITPGGDGLWVANQSGDSIATFGVDDETGELTPNQHVGDISSPTCVKFYQE